MYYRGAKAGLLVFDLTKQNGLEGIKESHRGK